MSVVVALVLYSSIAAGGGRGASDRPYISVYAAARSPEPLLEILFPPTLNLSSEARLLAVALGQPITKRWGLEWDAEGQLVRHFGDQDHFEVNALLVARWHPPALQDTVQTAIAVGEGFSYATAVPPLEPRDAREDEESARFLNYLMLEVELAPPGARRWSGFLRIHHRSGIFGLISNVKGGSNFIGLGLRRRF
ncbi:MAG: hypothetical protein KGY54_07875 [Oleiphilaceae bacterium]|nr:hypothetical protein [Oleiphilaceae bacterium]